MENAYASEAAALREFVRELASFKRRLQNFAIERMADTNFEHIDDAIENVIDELVAIADEEARR